jgi:hypothetical protein
MGPPISHLGGQQRHRRGKGKELYTFRGCNSIPVHYHVTPAVSQAISFSFVDRENQEVYLHLSTPARELLKHTSI